MELKIKDFMNLINKKYFISDFYSKVFYLIKVFLLFLPISIIIGNSAININCFIIIILYASIFFLKKDTFLEYKKIFYIFIFFLILSLINIFFSNYKDLSVISTLGIFRYFVVMVAFVYCLEKDNKFLLLFSKILFLVLVFVSLDSLLQYFTGKDLFGYENLSSHGKRLTGPFGDEYVVGAYISKLFFLSLFYFIYINKKFLLFITALFFTIIVILSNERMAMVMAMFSFFIFFIFSKNFNYGKKIILFFFVTSLLSSLFLFNKDFKENLIIKTLDQIGVTQKNIVKNEATHYNFWDSQWGAHFLTAYEIFKSYPVTGTGIKSFRFECKKDKYENIKSAEAKARCSTHPHNFYFEFLSETGILIFIPFVLLNFILLIKLIHISFLQEKIRNFSLVILCSYIILFFPIQSTGAFFSTWNGVFYWLNYSFVVYLLRKKTW